MAEDAITSELFSALVFAGIRKKIGNRHLAIRRIAPKPMSGAALRLVRRQDLTKRNRMLTGKRIPVVGRISSCVGYASARFVVAIKRLGVTEKAKADAQQTAANQLFHFGEVYKDFNPMHLFVRALASQTEESTLTREIAEDPARTPSHIFRCSP
jgi:hypothetical protein